jgi:hypothetical protein
MEISKLLLGFDEFKSRQEIIDLVLKSENVKPEDAEAPEALLIFQTSTQQTWFIATKSALYCVLDDISKSLTRIQWTIPRDEFKVVGEQLANVTAVEKNDRVGLLQIGKHKNWLYSKNLFAGDNVVNQLSRIVLRQMASRPAHEIDNGTLAVG